MFTGFVSSAEQMLRTGISTALNAGTKWQMEQLRKSVLGRFSTVESGKIARGPHARPRAKYTYGSSLRNGKNDSPADLQRDGGNVRD